MTHAERHFSFPTRQHLVPWLRKKYGQQTHPKYEMKIIMGLGVFSENEHILAPPLVNPAHSVVVSVTMVAWGLGDGELPRPSWENSAKGVT